MLRGELWLMVPGLGLRSLADLKANPAELDNFSDEGRVDPNGALGLTDEVEYVMVEDVLSGSTQFFLEELPDLLQAGQGGTYDFRSGPEQTSVTVDDGVATIIGYDDSEIETPVDDLAAVLAKLGAEYAEILKMLGAGG